MPITEDQVKKLTLCDWCGGDKVITPADVTLRAGNESVGFEDVHLCHACGDLEMWVRAPKLEIVQPEERKLWAEASMAERQAALMGYFEGCRPSEGV